MASNAASAQMAQDPLLTPRVALALVRHAVTQPAPGGDDIEARVQHAANKALTARLLADPLAEARRAQWAVAATRQDLADAYASKGAVAITDAQLDEAVPLVWAVLTAA